MRLNHINLTVSDVPAAAEFLTTYFGLTNQGGNAGMTVLTDTQGFDGMILTLMKAKAAAVTYPATFHVGFFIASRADIDALNAKLRDDGFDVEQPGETGHSYGFYISAPGGFQIEVGA